MSTLFAATTMTRYGVSTPIAPTILLVEDDPTVRQIMSEVLQHAGYRVIEASCPAEALKVFEKEWLQIDVLLTDVVMPGMKGTELARRLRSVQPGLIAVFMSGYTDQDVARTVHKDSGSLYLQKPFQLNTLLESIREALARKRDYSPSPDSKSPA